MTDSDHTPSPTHCINCGTEAPDHAKFCYACGASIYRQEARSQRSEPAETQSRVRANWFVKHWYGDLSLTQSFWVNFFLLNLIISGIQALLGNALDVPEEQFNRKLFQFVASIEVIQLVVLIWQVTGCWRSARRHMKRWDTYAGWSRVVQGILILSVATYVLYSPRKLEFLALATGLGPYSNYTLTISEDGEQLEVFGAMAYGIADEVAGILEQKPNISLVHLYSEGGRIVPARRLANLITQHELSTYVSEECDSACLLPFTAGTRRILHMDAKLGFHDWVMGFFDSSSDGLIEEVEKDRAHFRSIGVSDGFLDKAFSIPNDDMWYPSVQQLIANNIVTHSYDGFEFTDHR